MRSILTLALTAFLALPAAASAQTYLDTAATAAYVANDGVLPEDSLVDTIGTFIAALLSILGIVFLVLTIYAGILWMTAGGNSDQVKKAKAILVNAVIGLILTTASYGIAYFVVGSLS